MVSRLTPTAVAVRAGLQRGWIEFRQSITSGQDLWSILFFPIVALVVMFLLRNNTVPGTNFSLGSHSIPGIVGMNIVFLGVTSLSMALVMDRADGALLRAKATPNGVRGYVVGAVVSRAGTTLVSALIPLIPAALMFDGLDVASVTSWLTVAWVLALGLAAVLPLGVILGSVVSSPQAMSVVTLPMMVLVAISGVFYPITAMPEWLQGIAQIFPIYWLGLGLRSGLLPDGLAVAEIGESWRQLETIGLLGGWAVIGLLLAPAVVRRMASRESGSRVTERQRRMDRR